MSSVRPFDKLLTDLIRREGGFVHLQADRGGATKYGITLRTLEAWRGKPCTVEDVKALTEDEAKDIYTDLYIVKPKFDALPDPLSEQMIDFGVNSGPALATKALQELMGVTADGILGPKTLATALTKDVRVLNNSLVTWRVMMLGRIVRRDITQVKFLQGWLSRALSFIR